MQLEKICSININRLRIIILKYLKSEGIHMTNLKRVCLVMLVVILLGATVVFATGDTITITNDTTTVGGNEIDTNNTLGNDTMINAPQQIQTNTASTYNNTTNLPQTGADDYAVIAVIAVLAISAVYAYKKISDYKNI